MAEKIQWHPGFYAGMELELKAFDLSFDSEYQLTRGPLSIDLLIIKKLSDQKIDVFHRSSTRSCGSCPIMRSVQMWKDSSGRQER